MSVCAHYGFHGGIALAATTLVGNALGRGDEDDAALWGWNCALLTFAYGVIMSLLFIALASALGLLLPAGSDPFFILPVAVFGLLGALGLLVAWLGSERAVARLWNSR